MVNKTELTHTLVNTFLSGVRDVLTEEDISRVIKEVNEKYNLQIRYENGELSIPGEGEVEAYISLLSNLYEEIKVILGTGKARKLVMNVLGPTVRKLGKDLHQHDLVVRLPPPLRRFARKEVEEEIPETPPPEGAKPAEEIPPPPPSPEGAMPAEEIPPPPPPPEEIHRKEMPEGVKEVAMEDVIIAFSRIKGITIRRAKRLYHAGITSMDLLRGLSRERLAEILHLPESHVIEIYNSIHEVPVRREDIEREEVEEGEPEVIQPVPEKVAETPEKVEEIRPPEVKEEVSEVIPEMVSVPVSRRRVMRKDVRKIYLRRAMRRRYTLLGVLLVVTLLVSGIFVTIYPIRIEGGQPWEEVDLSKEITYSDPPDLTLDADADIVGYAVAPASSRITFMLELRSLPFTGVSEYGVLIDSDGRSSTGVLMSDPEMGADVKVTIRGEGNNLSASWYTYQSNPDHLNWSAWKEMGKALFRVEGKRVLLQTGRDLIGSTENARIRFYALTQTGSDLSDVVVSYGKPSLYLRCTPLDTRVLNFTEEKGILNITLEAKGGDISVNLNYTLQNIQSIPDPGVVNLKKGVPYSITVSAKGSGNPGSLASLDVIPSAQGSVITRHGYAYKGYAGSAPPAVSIDGAFADWDGVTGVSDPKGDTPDRNTDITSAKGTNHTSTGDLALYASVSGVILAGKDLPIRVAGGGGGGGGGVIVLPRVAGEDAARFYIDADGDLSGARLGDIYPEYMLEVKGINGMVTSSGAFRFSSGKWVRIGDISPGIGVSEVEVGVPWSTLGISPGSEVRVIAGMTSWNGQMDFTDSSFRGMDSTTGEPFYWHARGMVNIVSTSKQASATINNGDARGLAHADLDNDGDLDLIAAQATNDVITAFRNNGDGTWTPVDIAVNGQGIGQTFDVTAGDIDHDGAVDVIVSNNGRDIFILRNPLNTGTSPWAGAWGTVRDILNTPQNNVRAVGVSDLDNDGDLDAVGGDDNGQILITRNPYNAGANDPFTTAWAPDNYLVYNMGDQVNDICIADINNDGWDDIAAVSSWGMVVILKNPGNPFGTAWTSKVVAVLTPANTVSIRGSDTDHDGDPDLLVYAQATATTPNQVILYTNPFVEGATDPFNAGVTWSSVQVMSGGYRARAMVLSDLDRDGFDDMVTGSGEPAGRDLRVFENPHTTGSVWVQAQIVSVSAGEVHSVDAVDFDRDGDYDIFFGRSDGVLGFATNLLVHRDAYMRFGVEANMSMHAIAEIDAGDLDNDGDPDVVSAGGVWNQANEELWVYQNPGTASITSYQSWPRTAVSTYTGSIIRTGVKLVDLDNDGWLDIAVSNYWTNTVEMWVFRNDHTPFDGPWTTSSGLSDTNAYYQYGIDAADFDNDGDMDIVTSVYGSSSGARGRLWLWRNDGTPFDGGWSIAGVNFNQQTAYPMWKVKAVDLDNDGWVDLVAGGRGMTGGAPYNSWNLFVFQNTHNPFGGNTWVRVTLGALHVNTPEDVPGLDVADLDNDGYMDVVSCDSTGNTMAWRNDHTPFNGDGLEWSSVPVYSDPAYDLTAVAIADLNNDGWYDIVTGEKNGVTIITRNDGTPFDAPWWVEQRFNASVNITSIRLVDLDTRFDRDEDAGDPDIILGTRGSLSDPNAESPVVIWKNIGAMLNETVFDTSPAGIPAGMADDVMRIRVQHQGISSDLQVEISTWRFYFYDAAGNPLTAGAMQGWFDYFNLSYDINRNGIYDGSTDPVIASVSSSSVVSNEVVFTPSSRYAAIAYGSPENFFLVVDTSSGGKGGIFRVRYDPDGYGNPYNYMNQNTTTGVATIEPTATIRESDPMLTNPVEIIPELNPQIIGVAVMVPIILFLRQYRRRHGSVRASVSR